MARYRTRIVPAPSRVWIAYDDGPPIPDESGNESPILCGGFGGMNELSGTGVDTSYDTFSAMTDNIPNQLQGNPWWFHGCDHEKRQDTHATPTAIFTFSPPVPALHLRVHPHLSLRPTTIPSTLDWDPLVEKLATSLEAGSADALQALTIIGEARQTVQMLRNPLSPLLSHRCYKKYGNMPASAVKKVANVWLTYRYGWKPFLGDIEGTAKMLAKVSASGFDPKGRERFSANDMYSYSNAVRYPRNDASLWSTLSRLPPSSWGDSTASMRYRIKRENVLVKYRVGCEALDPIDRLKSHIGKILIASRATPSWRNIRDVIWELLPFSFVIDWFVDFSSIWRPLNEKAVLEKSLHRCCYSVETHNEAVPEYLFGRPMVCMYAVGTDEKQQFWYGKYPTNASPIILEGPSMHSQRYLRVAGLPSSLTTIFKSGGLDLIHGIDGISLFLQRFRRRT